MKFVLKWLVNGLIVVSLLMYYSNASFLGAASTATILTIIAYLLGDQIILRSTNNLVATLSDMILAYLVVRMAASMMNWTISPGETLVLALITGAAEWVIHRYVFQTKMSVQRA